MAPPYSAPSRASALLGVEALSPVVYALVRVGAEEPALRMRLKTAVQAHLLDPAVAVEAAGQSAQGPVDADVIVFTLAERAPNQGAAIHREAGAHARAGEVGSARDVLNQPFVVARCLFGDTDAPLGVAPKETLALASIVDPLTGGLLRALRPVIGAFIGIITPPEGGHCAVCADPISLPSAVEAADLTLSGTDHAIVGATARLVRGPVVAVVVPQGAGPAPLSEPVQSAGLDFALAGDAAIGIRARAEDLQLAVVADRGQDASPVESARYAGEVGAGVSAAQRGRLLGERAPIVAAEGIDADADQEGGPEGPSPPAWDVVVLNAHLSLTARCDLFCVAVTVFIDTIPGKSDARESWCTFTGAAGERGIYGDKRRRAGADAACSLGSAPFVGDTVPIVISSVTEGLVCRLTARSAPIIYGGLVPVHEAVVAAGL